jgi:hypothetical protein
MTIDVVPTGFPREWEGTTKYYRSLVSVVSYAGMTKDNPAPTPDVTYTVTPATVTETVDRGWTVTTAINGDIDVDEDLPPTYDNDPAVWTPALSGSPTWDPPGDAVETETTITVTREANGSWSGTETTVLTYSDEISQEDLLAALATARDDAMFDGTFEILPDGGIPTPEYTSDPFTGTKHLVIVEYSLGTYTGRPFISGVELVRRTVDSLYVIDRTPFTLTLSDPVTLTGTHGQDSFRDDDVILFSGWRRIDLLDRYPDDPAPFSGTVLAEIFPLSGHNYITATTGTLTNDASAAYLGGISAVPGSGDPTQFFTDIGHPSA